MLAISTLIVIRLVIAAAFELAISRANKQAQSQTSKPHFVRSRTFAAA